MKMYKGVYVMCIPSAPFNPAIPRIINRLKCRVAGADIGCNYPQPQETAASAQYLFSRRIIRSTIQQSGPAALAEGFDRKFFLAQIPMRQIAENQAFAD